MNKTITVYELLGKIKDGEIPKHIHLLPYSENNPTAGRYTYQNGDYLKDGWKNEWLFKDRLFKHLNDELEIIEENEIPEKLEKYYDENLQEYVVETYIKGVKYQEIFNSKYDEMIISKLNEVLDYLESKGE